tara:strand:+ start:8190 stop:10358 length:2169 start_codon:yes stop_codon:yes gene_type:complete
MLNEKAVSRKQQRFFGMVRAAQKGEAKATSPEVSRTAASIKMKDAKKFASTKHKGLPEKKMKKESVSEDAKMARQSDDKLSAAHKKFSGMEQTPANSFMKKRIEKEINRRKKSVKEDKEAYHTMSTKEFNKTHRDFKSGSKKKGNARVTKGVTNPSGTTTPSSRRVKFSDEYIYELDLKKIGKKIVNKAKEVWNRPIMKPNITKDQHLQKIRNSGGDTSHWESAQNEGALTTGAALTAAGLAAWKFAQGMKTRNQMKKNIDTPGTSLNKIKSATDQKTKLLQQMNQSYEPEGEMTEGFYQKRYTTGGYKTVGKNKRMDKSNKRSGDSKAQYRELHKDLAKIKKEETIVEKKKMVKIKVNRPIKTKVTDVGAGGKEYVRKDWSEENLTEITFSFRKTSKTKTEKKAEKAQDAGARGRRLLKRREYAAKISGSEENVPDDLRDSVQYEQSCGEGMYFCKEKGKCMPIPKGSKVEKGGNLVKETTELQRIQNAIKTKTMNGKSLTDKQIEGLKAGLTQGGNKVQEGAAWTKKAGKNKSGGLNEKGRKSYEKANPGSDLKAPSKKVGNPRRASFCARMSGMKKKLTSKKTANDPNSRINKSLRAWNCEYEPETPMLPEATRLKKEKGYDKGGTKKPTGPKVKDAALDAVKAKYKGQIMRKGSNQPKKVKGQKSTGVGKYLAKHKEKQQLKKDTKEMGYGSDTKSYVNAKARYGSKENMKSGKGLGT